MQDISEQIRRVDLKLRARYPELSTRIFGFENGYYGILCDPSNVPFSELKTEFDRSIRPITTPVQLIETPPEKYLARIDPLEDHEIGLSHAGMTFTAVDLVNLLASKFPNVSFVSVVGNEGDGLIKIHVEGTILEKERTHLNDFLRELNESVPFKIVEDSDHPRSSPRTTDVLYMTSPFLDRRSWDFEKRDEALWYDNLPAIYAGEFKKDQLYFHPSTGAACFVDFSVFPGANLRNHLILYDRVYWAPPIEPNTSAFFEQQLLHRDDIIELVHRDRLKLVLTQPASRYDTGLLSDAYGANNEGVISRRALNVLLAIDLVEISSKYFVNEMGLLPHLRELVFILSDLGMIDAKNLYNLLSWPLRALRTSFEVLGTSSPLRVGAFGINEPIQGVVSEQAGTDLFLEFTTASLNAHLSSALNASYFPFGQPGQFTDRQYVEVMANLLSFFKNATQERLGAFQSFKRVLHDGQKLAPDVSVLEVNTYMSLSEIDDLLNSIVTPNRVTSLLRFLASLDDEERITTVERYNNEVAELAARRNTNRRYFDFSYSAAVDFAGMGIPFLGTVLDVLSNSAKRFGIARSAKKAIGRSIERILHETDGDRSQVSFLEKIRPVARLKQKYE